MLMNRKRIRIEWGDCDPGGIAYFPRYFEYLDSCTNELFECAGLPKRQMMDSYGIAGIPLVESHAQFFIPSQFGDVVMVETSITEWGKSSFSVRHRLFKDDTLAAEVTEKRVWVMRSSGNSNKLFEGCSIPDDVKKRFVDGA